MNIHIATSKEMTVGEIKKLTEESDGCTNDTRRV